MRREGPLALLAEGSGWLVESVRTEARLAVLRWLRRHCYRRRGMVAVPDPTRTITIDPAAVTPSCRSSASTAFMTPVGYQTNLTVYGPGGFRFTDYLRVGGPLQLVFAVVTTLGIAAMWSL